MAYMNADTSAQIGFRPYGHTDPECAAQLSGLPGSGGLGEYYMNRPLDPWELHGLGDLGQNHPFKPEAWHLHGLGATDITAQAADELLAAGQITTAEHAAILEGSMDFVDVLGYDPTDQSSWTNLTSLFQEVNRELQTIEQGLVSANTARLQAGNTDPTLLAALNSLSVQLQQKRRQYADLATEFTHYYTLVMGSTPPGLAGLGFAPIFWIAGAVVFIVGAFIALYAIHAWSKGVDVNAIQAQAVQTHEVSTAATSQNLLKVLEEAQARGDTILAQSILKTLAATGAQPQTTSTIENWLMTNAKWIGLGAAGLLVVGPLAQGLFGGKRR